MGLRFVEVADGAVVDESAVPPDAVLLERSIGGHRGYVDLGCPGRTFVLAIGYAPAAAADGETAPLTLVVCAPPATPEPEPHIGGSGAVADSVHQGRLSHATMTTRYGEVVADMHAYLARSTSGDIATADGDDEEDSSRADAGAPGGADARSPSVASGRRSGGPGSTRTRSSSVGTAATDNDEEAGTVTTLPLTGGPSDDVPPISTSSSNDARGRGLAGGLVRSGSSSGSITAHVSGERDAVFVTLRRAKLEAARARDRAADEAAAAIGKNDGPPPADAQASPTPTSSTPRPSALARVGAWPAPTEAASPWIAITPAGTAITLYALAGVAGRTWAFPEASAVLDRLPAQDRSDSELPLALPMFCQPLGMPNAR